MQINTRKQAQEKGLRKYFTGRPCKKGHLTLRYVNTGACVACISLHGKKRYQIGEKLNHPARPRWLRVRAYKADDQKLIDYANGLMIARELGVL